VTKDAPVAERKGWRKVKVGNKFEWEPIPDPRSSTRRVPRPGDKLDLAGVDESLEGSHERMRRTLALQSRRLEVNAAAPGGLLPGEVDQLGQLSNTWRTLTTHEPEPDLGDLTPEQLQARLAALKARGK
jgi:hypothetical protein